MKKIYLKNKKIFIISLCHIIISFICSGFYFTKLLPDVGSENVAYGYLFTGLNLSLDTVSRLLCAVCSYILSVVLIYFFWCMLFEIAKVLKRKKLSGLFFVFIVVAGIGLILCFYPKMYGVETTDDYMNLVYAIEFLPMYWHSFWTDVVYCACMIFFPHPVIIPIVQFLFATSVVFYVIEGLIKHEPRRRKCAIVVAAIVMAVPLLSEIIRIFFYPTRNCMYAILCLYGISILFGDYRSKNRLTTNKFILLSIIFAFMGCWRGEGILYVLTFPLLIYIVYFVTEDGKKLFTPLFEMKDKKRVCKALVFYIVVCLLLMLPDKYGTAKYQNSDYMIANTTGPLSAIFKDENANLLYKDADEDLQNIEAVIPIKYIEKYGCNGGFYYNAQCGRFVRQSGSTKDEGSSYVKSALRIMIYNLPIWLKYQTNLFFDANQIGDFRFALDYGKETLENWLELDPYIRAFELYDCGETFLQEKEVLIMSSELDKKLEEGIHGVLNKAYSTVRSKMAWYKIVLIIGTVIGSIIALYRKHWLGLLLMLLNLAVLCTVILMAPWGRANYYYSVFINMLVALLMFGTSTTANESSEGSVRDAYEKSRKN